MVLVLHSWSGSNKSVSRYFDIEAGDGATTGDVARVGRALDKVFPADPFQLVLGFFEASAGSAPLPSIGDSWRRGGLTGVVTGLERRTAALASRQYTIAVILTLAIGLLAGVVLLWTSAPPRLSPGPASQSGRDVR